jgi:hypothetical membrane protein
VQGSTQTPLVPAVTNAAAARVCIVATIIALLSLAAWHVLSPEFSPSWRVVSEYALGRYPWVLSIMFFTWGIAIWALAVALRPVVSTTSGKAGLVLLVVSGLGAALASYFDINHAIGHMVAGVLGVLSFPIAALLVTAALARLDTWRSVRRPLYWLAHLNWISIVLLIVALAVMTMQMMRITGGHLPQHAPKALPAGVIGLDGWADRLIILSNCAWVLVAAVHCARLRRSAA